MCKYSYTHTFIEISSGPVFFVMYSATSLLTFYVSRNNQHICQNPTLFRSLKIENLREYHDRWGNLTSIQVRALPLPICPLGVSSRPIVYYPLSARSGWALQIARAFTSSFTSHPLDHSRETLKRSTLFLYWVKYCCRVFIPRVQFAPRSSRGFPRDY